MVTAATSLARSASGVFGGRLRCGGLLLAIAVGHHGRLVAQTPPAPPAAAPRAAPPLFVEVVGLPDRAYVQQRLPFTLRIGVDAAWTASMAVPLFQQRLDQPFLVELPWLLAAEERAVEGVPPPAGSRTQRVALGDRVVPFTVAAPVERDGTRYDVLEWRGSWLPLAPGTAVLAPVVVRYAYATRFEQDFVRGRVPVDRQEATVATAASALIVVAWPPGAPPGFTGAVGSYEVLGSPSPGPLVVGATCRMELRVAGVGNLDRIAVPPPPALAGWLVEGVRAGPVAPASRTFTFDLVPLVAGAQAWPALPFVSFEPTAQRYVTVASAALPCTVAPAAPELPLRPHVQAAIDRWSASERAAAAWPLWRYALGLAALAGVASLGWWWLQRRRRHAAVVAALQQLEQAPAAGPAAVLAAFDRVLASALGLPAWPSDGASRLLAAGHAAAVVANVTALRARLDAARFGGASVPGDEVLAVVLAVAGR